MVAHSTRDVHRCLRMERFNLSPLCNDCQLMQLLGVFVKAACLDLRISTDWKTAMQCYFSTPQAGEVTVGCSTEMGFHEHLIN